MKCNLKRTLIALCLSAALFLTGVPYAPATETCAATVDGEEISYYIRYNQSDARGMLTQINSFRTSGSAWYWDETNSVREKPENLVAYEYDYGLEKVAMQRAAEIASYYSYTRPDGQSYLTAYDGYSHAGECICSGLSSASDVLQFWRGDAENYKGQANRRNLLNDDFAYIGIGHVVSNGVHFWVAEFHNISTGGEKTSVSSAQQKFTTYYKSSYSGGTQVVFPSDAASSVTVGTPVDLSGAKLILNPGKTQIVLIKDLDWDTSNPSVAAVSKGKISTKSIGTTTITAYTTIFGKDASSTWLLTVTSAPASQTDTSTGTGTGSDGSGTSSGSSTASGTSGSTDTSGSGASSGSETTDTKVETQAPKTGDTFVFNRATYRITNADSRTVIYVSYDGDATKVTIPTTVEYQELGFAVTKVADNAFALNDTIKKVVVGNRVTQIGSKAFAECDALTSVTIGTKVKKIGAKAFSGCTSLKKLTVKSSKLTKAGVKNALSGSSVTKVVLSGSGAKKKLATYKKYFTKANAGKAVTVKNA